MVSRKCADGILFRFFVGLIAQRSKGGPLLKTRFLRFRFAISADNEILDFFLRRFKRRFAMGFERRTAFIESDGILKRRLPAFELLHDLFEFREGVFKGQGGDVVQLFGHKAAFYWLAPLSLSMFRRIRQGLATPHRDQALRRAA